jgi:hypothetical protein
MTDTPKAYVQPNLVLSAHVRRRFKLRANLPPRAAERACRLALEKGLHLRELPSFMQRNLAGAFLRHGHKAPLDVQFVKVFRGLAFIFSIKPSGDLWAITVLPGYELPSDNGVIYNGPVYS